MSLVIRKFMLICVLMLLYVHDIFGVQINVANSLKGNLNLSLHCRSGGPGVHDLGVQVLKPGASFGWRTGFEINETYYTCLFQWKGESHYYNIYRAGRDDCNICNWYITESGPCKVQSHNRATCYSWNN